MCVSSVIVDGVLYDVSMDYDSDGVIEYFNLVDSDGEIIFEADWQGDIAADEIVEMYRSYLSDNAVVEDAMADLSCDNSSDDSAGSNVDNSDSAVDFSFFDAAFPHLANYPDRFKKIAMERFESFSHESFRFKKNCSGGAC